MRSSELGFMAKLGNLVNKKTWSLKVLKKDKGTLPETNIAPGNRPSQEEMTSSNHPFSGAMLVSGSGINIGDLLD